ncbi:SARP family transcriptional regulator [Microtetraspora sp. NBRC 13810]|uniref:AfsR/SARP family transcriptional regulator n=1 Tax=Microtetraspora sp. NBRC 13810 TaxID=3030990 RepID=UPI00249FC2E5|nr:tetratricopeptide repeat protein [Microtetraspora sp. NBRC 13810]GLW05747.1 SARP family transcriptional regulator [Microtetraspora sp. NBRC 13810]
MEFRVLGSVELRADGALRELGSAKERFVLALLLLTPRQPVSIESMIERVWGDTPPSKARGSVHSYIARLRGRLQFGAHEARVSSRPGAYLLDVDPERIDLHRFRRLYAQARAIADSGDAEDALRLLRDAEELWRGEPLSGLSGEWVEKFRISLENEHRAVIGMRLALELEAGRHSELIGELYRLVGQHPYDESFVEDLMVALYRCNRQGDALEAYHQARRRLVGDLGAEPAASLRGTYERILRGDPGLAAPPVQRAQGTSLADTLPRDTADFTGREAELQRLYEALDPTPTAVSIEAIDGMAGIGKSALAIHAAHRLAHRYPDGRLYLHLHAHDPNRPPVEAADALKSLLHMIGEDPRWIPDRLEERAALWRARLANRRTLVVLDDAAGADQVRPLLPGTPGCLVLITSRRRLAGLDGVRPLSLDILAPNDAALLFRRIVGLDRKVDARAVKEVVSLCGHLPLAVTIVANKLRHRPARGVDGLATRLSRARDRLAEMHAEDSDLSSAFDLSYRELSAEGQRAFRRLGLHVGDDLSTDAAAALIGYDRATTERVLEGLIDRHLVEEPHPGRVRLHDLLRDYARERAAAVPWEEPRQAVHRLLDFYLHTADQAGRRLYPHRRPVDVRVSYPPVDAPEVTEPRTAVEWLRAERANLLACVRYAAHHGFSAHAALLPRILAQYLEWSAHWEDALDIHEISRRVCRETGHRGGEAHAELELSLVRSRTGYYDAAFEHAQAGLRAFREINDRRGEADTLDHLARVSWLSGRNQAAVAYAERAIALYRELGVAHGEGEALLHKGNALNYLGRTEEAVAAFEQSWEIARTLDNAPFGAMALNNIGQWRFDRGRHREALELFQRALAIMREVGWRQNEAVALNNVANVHQYKGRYDEALHFYREALSVYRETGDRRHEADALSNIGRTYLLREMHAQALIHFHKALALAREISDPYQEIRALHAMGEAQRGSGQYTPAYETYQRGLREARRLEDPALEAACLQGLGETSLHMRGHEAARPFLEQALAIFEALDAPESEIIRLRLQGVEATGS